MTAMNERDVEFAYIDWLNTQPCQKVLGRQIHLPLGILDVLSVHISDGGCSPAVSEIKLGKVDEKALTQVMGYSSQIEVLIGCNVDVLDGEHEEYNPVNCGSVLVGTEMTPLVQRVYHAFGVSFVQFEIIHGGIEFSQADSAGMYGESTDIDGALANLAGITKAWRTGHRKRNAASLRSSDNYTYLMNGRDQNPLDRLENTVAYWTKKR
jgi:hypothetical protein